MTKKISMLKKEQGTHFKICIIKEIIKAMFDQKEFHNYYIVEEIDTRKHEISKKICSSMPIRSILEIIAHVVSGSADEDVKRSSNKALKKSFSILNIGNLKLSKVMVITSAALIFQSSNNRSSEYSIVLNNTPLKISNFWHIGTEEKFFKDTRLYKSLTNWCRK
jgi:hypothetical protein